MVPANNFTEKNSWSGYTKYNLVRMHNTTYMFVFRDEHYVFDKQFSVLFPGKDCSFCFCDSSQPILIYVGLMSYQFSVSTLAYELVSYLFKLCLETHAGQILLVHLLLVLVNTISEKSLWHQAVVASSFNLST